METLNYLRLKALVTPIRILGYTLQFTTAYPDDILHIPSRDSNRTIKLHIYKSSADATTDGSSTTASKRRRVLINFHGSGFVIPSHGGDDAFCRHIADETRYVVLDAQYRLSPECPFPAAFNDVEDVVSWVLTHPDDYDTSHIALGGFSAGGNLVLAAATSLPEDTVHTVLAFYPPTDISIPPHEKIAPDPSGRPIPAIVANIFNQCYLLGGTSPADPRVSPTHAPPERFPKNVLIVTAAGDNLAKEAEELAQRIEKEKGKNVVWKRMEGCSHGFDKGNYQDGSPEKIARDEAYALAVEMLRLAG